MRNQLEEMIANRVEIDGPETDEPMDTTEAEGCNEDYDMQENDEEVIETIDQYEQDPDNKEMIEFVYVDAESIKTVQAKDDQKWLECNICDAQFTKKENLDLHAREHFAKVDRKLAGKLINKKSSVKYDNKMESLVLSDLLKNFDCLTCGESFPFEFLLSKHALKHKVQNWNIFMRN